MPIGSIISVKHTVLTIWYPPSNCDGQDRLYPTPLTSLPYTSIIKTSTYILQIDPPQYDMHFDVARSRDSFRLSASMGGAWSLRCLHQPSHRRDKDDC